MKIYEELKNIFESKLLFRVLCGIGIIIVALLIFSAGIIVGFDKASFGHAWEENYEHNFGIKPNHPILDNFPNADGAIGKIIKVELPTIIVTDRNNTEKVVAISAETHINKMQENLSANDLKIDDFVVVIGSPDSQGQIDAKFIRVIPSGLPVAPTDNDISAPTQ